MESSDSWERNKLEFFSHKIGLVQFIWRNKSTDFINTLVGNGVPAVCFLLDSKAPNSHVLNLFQCLNDRKIKIDFSLVFKHESYGEISLGKYIDEYWYLFSKEIRQELLKNRNMVSSLDQSS